MIKIINFIQKSKLNLLILQRKFSDFINNHNERFLINSIKLVFITLKKIYIYTLI